MLMTVIRSCREKQNKYTKTCGFTVTLFGVILLSACQSNSQLSNTTAGAKSASAERPLQVNRSLDGIQDVRWEITQIQGQKAKYFHNQPYLQFSSAQKQIRGNTGCNELTGTYVMDTGRSSVKMNARAGYFSCDTALVQEAMLMDSLEDTVRFQVNGKQLTLQDKRGEILLRAEKK